MAVLVVVAAAALHRTRRWPVGVLLAAAALAALFAAGVGVLLVMRRRGGAPGSLGSSGGARVPVQPLVPAPPRVPGLPGRYSTPSGWARSADLAVLQVRELPGNRLPLGQFGRRLLAAEHRQSVLVVGPSQSGKTSGLAIPAIRAWDGPVLATSVKGDLLRDTVEARRSVGRVSVYDPTGTTAGAGVLASGELEGWSPLLASTTWPGARRVAASMCSVAAADHGMEDAGFWYASAEKLLAPLLFAAATAGTTMSDVVRWIDDEEMEEPLLALELAAVPDATRAARTSFAREDRQRASVFSTAETVVAAFSDPGVAASASRASLDPRSLAAEGLREGARTLYCCAPAREQERLRPVFTALVREALDGAFESAAKRGGTLEPGLLVVLDEAANVAPVAELDGVVSTAAGHGITVLTVWQDLAQIEARYGRRWSTIVNNHRAKVVCGGIADSLTLEHLEQLIGDHEHLDVSRTVAADGTTSRTESNARRSTALAGSLRRVPPGQAVLVYGSLPPAGISLLRDRPAGTTRAGCRRRSSVGRRLELALRSWLPRRRERMEQPS